MKIRERSMWVLAMFDLPTEEEIDKKNYRQFRKFLLNSGFEMMQYSVYIRHCGTVSTVDSYVTKIKKNLPTDGKVQILKFTDKQFGDMLTFYGKNQIERIKEPEKIVFI